MADNVTLNAGTGGATLATDDVSSVHYQVVKIDVGADGLAAPLGNSNPIPVSDAGGSLTVDNAGITTIAGAVSGTEMQVDIVSGNVTNAGTFAVQVDGAALTALQLIDNLVLAEDAVHGTGDPGVQALAVRNDTLAALAGTDGDYAPLQVNASGALYAAISGTVTVDGSGVTQPVSGTVTANLSATDNAVLDVIETNTSGSTSHYRNIDANAEAEIKGSAGTLHWLHAMNLTAAKAYLHLYDATAASVTPGTTTPDFTFAMATQGDTNGAGFVLPAPIEFASGITMVVTTTLDGSAGDPGTNGVIVNAGYT